MLIQVKTGKICWQDEVGRTFQSQREFGEVEDKIELRAAVLRRAKTLEPSYDLKGAQS